MNLKKKIKGFFTLTRKANSGFTLVELIVVIAILAILGGVAVPAYSGYVKKANKSADEQLVSDVMQAIQLYAYANNLTGEDQPNGVIGYVVLTMEEGAVAKDSGNGETDHMVAAMRATFGDSYPETLRLKHDGWADAATMLNEVANNIYAASVNDSTYITEIGTEKLLGDVQRCATSLGEFLNAFHSDKTEATNSMINRFTDPAPIKEMLSDAGYETEEDYANISKEVLQNITVFGVASAVKKDPVTVSESFATPDMLRDTDISVNDKLDKIANWYAALEGLVAYLDDEECTEAFNHIDLNGEAAGIAGSMNAARNEILGRYETDDEAFKKKVDDYYTPVNGTSQAMLDGEAYVGIMTSVDNLKTDYVENKNAMSDANLFAGGSLDNRVNSFVTAAALSAQINDAELQAILNGTESAAVVVARAYNGALRCDPLPAEVLTEG